MRSRTIALLLGLWCATYSTLPIDPIFFQLLPLSAVMCVLRNSAALLAGFATGFLWFAANTYEVLSERLPGHLEGVDMTVEGVVLGIPEHKPGRSRFVFEPHAVSHNGAPVRARMRLSWYEPEQRPRAGERWRFSVRLKQPHGSMSPGTFDYERWLFARRIGAVGYVRQSPVAPSRLSMSKHSLAHWRERWIEQLSLALDEHPCAALILAISVGYRGALSEAQWQVMRETGTAHLMAISGLHVGIVAAFWFWVLKLCWRCLGRAPERLAAPRIAGLGTVFGAAAYALFAGFSVPTQRALVMILAFMLGLFFRRRFLPSRVLAAAALVVVLIEPFALLMPGFWLSFVAVGVMLFCLSPRDARVAEGLAGVWARWGRVHVVVTLGLVPCTLFFFGTQSLLAPVANLVAVPWVALLVVPTALVGSILQLCLPQFGTPILDIAAWLMFVIWAWLEWLSNLGWVYTATAAVPLWVAACALIGVLIALGPRGVPGRWVGWLAALSLVMPLSGGEPHDELRLTVLDVGQGLAVVVEVDGRVLVYDTGPSFRTGTDAGQLVVLPYLRTLGVAAIDVMVVSHGDSDHSGGANSLAHAMPVHEVISNSASVTASTPCVTGLSWQWGEAVFDILAPSEVPVADTNDASCVLKIEHPGGKVLLTGDIERHAEARLLQLSTTAALKADILIAPHHGSRSSSTPAFVDAVGARYVVFGVGYRNRYRLPAADVVQRYQSRGALTYSTDREGSTLFVLVAGGPVLPPFSYRDTDGRVWHWRDVD